jgi:hypothetical protein
MIPNSLRALDSKDFQHFALTTELFDGLVHVYSTISEADAIKICDEMEWKSAYFLIHGNKSVKFNSNRIFQANRPYLFNENSISDGALDISISCDKGPQRLEDIIQPHQVRITCDPMTSERDVRRIICGSSWSDYIWRIILCDEYNRPIGTQSRLFLSAKDAIHSINKNIVFANNTDYLSQPFGKEYVYQIN